MNKKKLFKIFLFIFVSPFIYLIIKIISPVRTIKFGQLTSERIGHFSANTELYLCNKLLKKNKSIDFFFNRYPICNQYFNQIIKNKVNLINECLGHAIFKLLQILGEKNHIINFNNEDRDTENILQKCDKILSMSKNDVEIGYEKIKKFGLNTGDKWICVIARDSYYLKKNLDKIDFSYHDYRDSNINNYYKAMNYLTAKGYFVFRMGKDMHNPLNTNNPKIIDYAFSPYKSDFLDIFLSAECDFFISGGTGLDSIALINRKPILMVNQNPIGLFYSYYEKIINYPKIIIHKDSNKILSLKEIINNDLHTEINQKNFEKFLYLENTKDEILSSTKEMINLLNGNLVLNEIEKKRNKVFLNILKPKNLFLKKSKLHGEIKAIISPTFFHNYKNFLI